jgi:hypothetical protein
MSIGFAIGLAIDKILPMHEGCISNQQMVELLFVMHVQQCVCMFSKA